MRMKSFFQKRHVNDKIACLQSYGSKQTVRPLPYGSSNPNLPI